VVSINNVVPFAEPVDRDRWQRVSAPTRHPHQLPATARPYWRSKRVVKRHGLFRLDRPNNRVERNRLETQVTAVCAPVEAAGKQLKTRMIMAPRSPLAESLTAPLPHQALKRVLGIDAQKPSHRKDGVDDKSHRSEARNQREHRDPKRYGSRRYATEGEHKKATRGNTVQRRSPGVSLTACGHGSLTSHHVLARRPIAPGHLPETALGAALIRARAGSSNREHGRRGQATPWSSMHSLRPWASSRFVSWVAIAPRRHGGRLPDRRVCPGRHCSAGEFGTFREAWSEGVAVR
jgi:hypothetical protein